MNWLAAGWEAEQPGLKPELMKDTVPTGASSLLCTMPGHRTHISTLRISKILFINFWHSTESGDNFEVESSANI